MENLVGKTTKRARLALDATIPDSEGEDAHNKPAGSCIVILKVSQF